MDIQKAAVLGAGVMGASIAAHLANAGIPVILLDIVPEGAGNRSVIAEQAVQRLLKADPAPLMHAKNARLIEPGNLEDHLGRLGSADWIIEAVTERLDIKQALYRRIDPVRKAGSIVSSNTSTIPLAKLGEGLSPGFRRDFLITHFFNPPRYMRLLELVASTATRPEAVAAVREFADLRLGKGVVSCKDTPGFIGNRIGVYWLQLGLLEAMRLGLTVEEADAIMSEPFGIPKTGVFGLLDLVGIDLVPHIVASMSHSLPTDDPFHAISRIPERMTKMIAEGYTGRKGKGGFYRLNAAGGAKVKEAIDWESSAYRPSIKPELASIKASKAAGKADRLRVLLEFSDKTGHYAWRVLAQTLTYAAGLIPQIADDIVAVDQAMKWGYNWEYGPFELIDRLGVEWFVGKLREEGAEVPPLLQPARPMYQVIDGRLHHLRLDGGYQPVQRPAGVFLLADVKRAGKPLARNASASLWDVGDGVACLEFHSKMNTLDPQIMGMIEQSIDIVSKGYQALVIHNEAANFSAGANLGVLLYAINVALWPEVENMVRQGQQVYRALKYAPFPVVAAPSGLALGGGCELLLHCDAVQAHAELYTGLVELGVGVVPAWGGCKEMLNRWFANPRYPRGPVAPVGKVFEIISMATVSKSAQEARDHLFLRHSDGITMNKDRLLADAKARALALSADYKPPEPPLYYLPGPSGKAALDLAIQQARMQGKATAHDAVVAGKLAEVLTGGETDLLYPLTEEDVMRLEREAFGWLIRQPGTIARMDHMLETGKPLRN
jgi:3-hydroxyacyl-CoA dehydrogenase